ncbi:MAG: hypothetical protein JWQ72_3639 [Polaromonas sp.]|nr:hypothetical protein [Polaromonas sp.]
MPDTTPGSTRIRAALRMGPSTCRGPDGQPGMLLAVRDVTGTFEETLAVAWLGSEGIDFMRQNSAELTPGRCVDLEIFKVRIAGTELRARIRTCAMAPKAPSHVKHEEKSQQEQQAA